MTTPINIDGNSKKKMELQANLRHMGIKFPYDATVKELEDIYTKELAKQWKEQAHRGTVIRRRQPKKTAENPGATDQEAQRTEIEKPAPIETVVRSAPAYKKIVDPDKPLRKTTRKRKTSTAAKNDIPFLPLKNDKTQEREAKRKEAEEKNPLFSLARKRAAGSCQLCSKPAPYRDKNSLPFLEIHHLVAIEDGGEDELTNMVALCPKCHRRMHELHSEADLVKLQNIVSNMS